MICQRIKLLCVLLIITYLSASGQPLLQSWKKVESRLIERNKVASELNAFSLSLNLIATEEATCTQVLADSLDNLIKLSKKITPKFVKDVANLNKKIEQNISSQISKIEGTGLPSTSGNALRLVAISNRAKEELFRSIEEHNKQAISIKRKDLVFPLSD